MATPNDDETPDEITFVGIEWWGTHMPEMYDAVLAAYDRTALHVWEGDVPATEAEPGTAGSRRRVSNVNRLTLTVEEAAAALGISRAFAYEAVHRGEIPHVRIGRRILVPKAALEQLVDPSREDADR